MAISSKQINPIIVEYHSIGVAGAIRYNGGILEYHNGTSWGPLTGLADGTSTNNTLRWNSTDWVETSVLKISTTGIITNLTKLTETYITTGTTGAVTLDWSLGNVFYTDMTGAITYSYSNLPGSGLSQEIVLYIKQPSAGGPFTPTFPGTTTWGSAGTPIWTTTASRYDVVILRKLNVLTNVTAVYVNGDFV